MCFYVEMSAAKLITELCPKVFVHIAQSGYVRVAKGNAKECDFKLMKELIIDAGYHVKTVIQ